MAKKAVIAISNNPVTEDALVTSVSAVVERRRHWEANEEKASNAKLYQILQDVYELHKRFDGESAWGKLLTIYLNDKLGRKVSDKTTLMSKLVHVVFDPDNRDLKPLVGALRIAHKQKVPGDQLASWLTTNGGVYKVRKDITLTKKGVESGDGAIDERTKNMINAEAGCKANKPLASITTPVLTVPDFATDTHGDYVVALCTNINGKLNLHHYSSHKGIVENYLERLGKVMPAQAKAADTPTLADVEAQLSTVGKSKKSKADTAS